MVISCSAYNCTNRFGALREDKTKLKFHRFPFRKPELFKKWIVAVRRKKWQPSEGSVLCGVHFSEDAYKAPARRFLKDDAIPTIFNFPNQLQQELDSLKPRAELKSLNPLSVKQEPFEVISNDTDIQTALFGGSDKNHILLVPGDTDIQSTFSSNYGNTYDENQVLIISDDKGIQTMLKNEDGVDSDDNRTIIISEGTNMQYEWCGSIKEDSFLNGVVTLDATNIGIRSLNNCNADSSYKNPLLLHNSKFYVKRIEELEVVIAKLQRKRKLLCQVTRRRKMKISRLQKNISGIITKSRPLPCSAHPIVHLIACDL